LRLEEELMQVLVRDEEQVPHWRRIASGLRGRLSSGLEIAWSRTS
jgi:hypothetical protein